MLYIVATPIGNLDDMTHRAVQTLHDVDFIVCEDTRHSKKLLDHYGIQKRLTSFHAHSTQKDINAIVHKLRDGEKAAFISDAGTPGISDPGYTLTKGVLAEGIEVVPIPGASAFLTALMASGMPINRFHYLGFLPQKKGRQTLLESLAQEEATVVFYESPHRITKTLEELEEALGGERPLTIARELTKLHEEFFRGTIAEAKEHFQKPKGEFVLILGGITPTKEKRQKYPQ